MKKLITMELSIFLIAGLFTSCSENKVSERKLISAEEAKRCAIDQIDNVSEDGADGCKIQEVKLINNQKYLVTAIVKDKDEAGNEDGLFYEISIDAADGAPLQVESESLEAHNGTFTFDMGKEKIKERVCREIFGTSTSAVIKCKHCNSDYGSSLIGALIKKINAYYDVVVYRNNKLYSFKVGAMTGNILERSVKEVGQKEGDSTKRESDIPVGRPVWLIGHRCNTNYTYNRRAASGAQLPDNKRDVRIALDGGCNGVEVDIRHRSCDDSMRLCHDNSVTIYYSESIREFLKLSDMHDSRLCLVIFDIKEPKWMNKIIDDVHASQDEDPVLKNIYFLYSVSSLSDAREYFTSYVASRLRENEGLCVDMDDNAPGVNQLYNDLHFKRGWYGNGIFSGVYGSGTVNGCRQAVGYRNNRLNNPEKYPYNIIGVESWTSHRIGDLKTRLGWGIDSVMLDSPAKKEARNGLVNGDRLATRSDNPFGER